MPKSIPGKPQIENLATVDLHLKAEVVSLIDILDELSARIWGALVTFNWPRHDLRVYERWPGSVRMVGSCPIGVRADLAMKR